MPALATSAAFWSPETSPDHAGLRANRADRADRAIWARVVRLGGIAAVHGLVAWGLLHADVISVVLLQASPLMVALLNDAPLAPPVAPALPLPVARSRPTLAPALPPPEITVASAPPAPPAAPIAAPIAAPAAAVAVAVVPVVSPSATVVEPPPQRTPAPPVALPSAPRQLPASAIRYRVPPAVEVPMASRRLGESGTVLLRVQVDAQGLPRQISLHRSSGHARLDEQALVAMRTARFQPVAEDSAAVEWLVIAPLQYDVD